MSSKLSAALVAASVVMFASAGAALASPATVTSNVNVRSGPGSTYGVVDIVRRGEYVELVGCQNTWCYVARQGSEGWVSAAYLNSSAAAPHPSVSVDFGFDPRSSPAYQRPWPPLPAYNDWGGDDSNWRGDRSWGDDTIWRQNNPWDGHHRSREWY